MNALENAVLVFGITYVTVVTALRSPNPLFNGEWENFKLEHSRSYGDGKEELQRRLIFEDNMKLIEETNKKNLSYTLGITSFTDMTFEEFKDEYLGLEVPENYTNEAEYSYLPKSLSLPYEVNWVKKGIVTRVKHQGRCGSCWAFSATGAIESAYAKATGNLVELSDQNMVDCVRRSGCHGGWPYECFRWVLRNGGIATESSYPYNGRDTGGCRFRSTQVGAKITGERAVPRYEYALQQHVAKYGPISVCIGITREMMYHRRGVFDDWTCSQRPMHAVLLVGYGVEYGKPYWLVKNSWGRAWGERGYVKMVRNKQNQCGIASVARFPIA